MTNEERDSINKAIAVDLGWTCGPCEICLDGSPGHWTSPEGKTLGVGYIPDFHSDPALSLMLMERGRMTVMPWKGSWQAAATEKGWSQAPTIGEAVARAYCRMRGLDAKK